MDVTKPYEFIGFGAMYVTKPYEFIGFGASGAWPSYAQPMVARWMLHAHEKGFGFEDSSDPEVLNLFFLRIRF